jgi:hypothetical protein
MLPENMLSFFFPIGFAFFPFVVSCFGSFGPTAVQFLYSLADLELQLSKILSSLDRVFRLWSNLLPVLSFELFATDKSQLVLGMLLQRLLVCVSPVRQSAYLSCDPSPAVCSFGGTASHARAGTHRRRRPHLAIPPTCSSLPVHPPTRRPACLANLQKARAPRGSARAARLRLHACLHAGCLPAKPPTRKPASQPASQPASPPACATG